MEPSIFTIIVRGDIPSHKVYEDDKTLAFLNIHPSMPGHTLVVPKTQVARLQDLTDEDYQAVMATVKKVMQRQLQVFGDEFKACVKVMGFDVPHAHVHVIPCRTPADFRLEEDQSGEPDHKALADMASKLKF
jgi:histidine triad (HIT) family protein